LKVKSRAYKIKVDTDSEFRVDGERNLPMIEVQVAEKKTNEAVNKEVSREKLLLGGGRERVVAPLADTDYDHRLKKQRLK
jgi:uncharacterized Zn finger protein